MTTQTEVLSYRFLQEHWPGQDLNPWRIGAHRKENGRTWLEEVQAILFAEGAKDLTDGELRRCTAGCVAGELLFHLAIVFRGAGMVRRPA